MFIFHPLSRLKTSQNKHNNYKSHWSDGCMNKLVCLYQMGLFMDSPYRGPTLKTPSKRKKERGFVFYLISFRGVNWRQIMSYQIFCIIKFFGKVNLNKQAIAKTCKCNVSTNFFLLLFFQCNVLTTNLSKHWKGWFRL